MDTWDPRRKPTHASRHSTGISCFNECREHESLDPRRASNRYDVCLTAVMRGGTERASGLRGSPAQIVRAVRESGSPS
jgi:hypothetical protein